jgi:hypothetical protein
MCENENAIQDNDPINERANRLKAVDITIDSLKQYITLSTVAIAGLLAFFNGNGKEGTKWLFVIAVLGFILCAIASIWTINTFINKVHNHIIDVRHPLLRKSNFSAIILFLIGVGFSAAFFFSSQKTTQVINPVDSKIVIQDKSVVIGEAVKTKVVIKTDSLTKIKTILINQ